jgi:hypothetical protein
LATFCEQYSLDESTAVKISCGFGSIICKEILGCDISTADGMRKAEEEGLFDSICKEFVRDSVQILKELI